jgi:hypothetical protein
MITDGGDYWIPAFAGMTATLWTRISAGSLTYDHRRKFAENGAIMVPHNSGNTA